jgi:ubiquinone/menaquinone biosynthesis C-methylase UbiE
MSTNYDPIAEQYRRVKEQPCSIHIETYTFLELIGDVAGKNVIDLACGGGFYTRRVKQRGAANVTGIDLSPRMIELARAEEAKERLGITYLVGDAKDLKLEAQFDLAISAYLLNHAKNRADLAAMCQAIARCLKPDGRFVTVNSSPLIDFKSAPSYRQYGMEVIVPGELHEGAPIIKRFLLGEETFDIEDYFLDAAIHEEAFRMAGFRDIRWHQPRLSPEGEAVFGREFWDIYLQNPPIAFIECFK